MELTYQKLGKDFSDSYVMAEVYYSVLSSLNRISLTSREINLLAFMAIRGNISIAKHRQDFCSIYSTTIATLNNTVSSLRKKGFITKRDGRIVPSVVLDFSKDVLLNINLRHDRKQT